MNVGDQNCQSSSNALHTHTRIRTSQAMPGGGGGLTLGPIEEVAELRLLNETTFPVRYNEKFYAEVLTLRPEHAKYAYWNGRVVGAICCRLEPHDVPGRRRLYIMTLGVQATYRGRGIGSRLLDSVLEAVRRGNKEAATASCPASPPSAATEAGGEQQAPEGGSGGVMVADVYLHVQTSNADALHFYKKFGFANRGIIRHYYRRIEPPDCYVLGLSLAEEGAGYQAQRAALGQAAPTEMIVA